MRVSDITIADIKRRCRINENECWVWLGAVGGNRSPRPQIRINSKLWYVSKLVWFKLNGNPGSLLVCHHCDEPLCVNPEHLYLATQTQNMRDASSRGRLHKTVINEGIAETIKRLKEKGHSLKEISSITNVPYGTVTHIVYNYRWT